MTVTARPTVAGGREPRLRRTAGHGTALVRQRPPCAPRHARPPVRSILDPVSTAISPNMPSTADHMLTAGVLRRHSPSTPRPGPAPSLARGAPSPPPRAVRGVRLQGHRRVGRGPQPAGTARALAAATATARRGAEAAPASATCSSASAEDLDRALQGWERADGRGR